MVGELLRAFESFPDLSIESSASVLPVDPALARLHNMASRSIGGVMTTVLPSMPPKSFTYRLTVPLHEIDAAGIMFYGHLFRHAHDAYEGFMASIGFPLDGIIRDRESLLPLVHAQADYRFPLRHGESVTVHLCVEKVGRTSFTLRYLFEDAEHQVRAEARTVHVHLDAQLGSSAPLPEDLEKALADWLCGAGS